MLYDIPGRTGIAIGRRHLRGGSPRTSAVVAVKDAVGDLARGVRLMAETGLAFYSGDDDLNLAWLTHGAAGVVSVVGHVAGREYAAMVGLPWPGATSPRRWRPTAGSPRSSTSSWHRVQGAMTAKAAMQLLGVLDNRNVRLPARPARRRASSSRELRSAVLRRSAVLDTEGTP